MTGEREVEARGGGRALDAERMQAEEDARHVAQPLGAARERAVERLSPRHGAWTRE